MCVNAPPPFINMKNINVLSCRTVPLPSGPSVLVEYARYGFNFLLWSNRKWFLFCGGRRPAGASQWQGGLLCLLAGQGKCLGGKFGNLMTPVRAVTMATGIKNDGEMLRRRLRPHSFTVCHQSARSSCQKPGSLQSARLFAFARFISTFEGFRWCFGTTEPSGSTCMWRLFSWNWQEQPSAVKPQIWEEKLLFTKIIPASHQIIKIKTALLENQIILPWAAELYEEIQSFHHLIKRDRSETFQTSSEDQPESWTFTLWWWIISNTFQKSCFHIKTQINKLLLFVSRLFVCLPPTWWVAWWERLVRPFKLCKAWKHNWRPQWAKEKTVWFETDHIQGGASFTFTVDPHSIFTQTSGTVLD